MDKISNVIGSTVLAGKEQTGLLTFYVDSDVSELVHECVVFGFTTIVVTGVSMTAGPAELVPGLHLLKIIDRGVYQIPIFFEVNRPMGFHGPRRIFAIKSDCLAMLGFFRRPRAVSLNVMTLHPGFAIARSLAVRFLVQLVKIIIQFL